MSRLTCSHGLDTLALMKKIKKVLVVLFALLLLSSAIFLFIKFFRPKAAGLYIDSRPASEVYINNQKVGQTPYRTKRLKAGEISLRLIPQSLDYDFGYYDTKIYLLENTESVVKLDFGKNGKKSSLELITFEKTDGMSKMKIVTLPQAAKITIDGKGDYISPQIIEDTLPGEHKIEIMLERYESKELILKTYNNFRLIFYTELSEISATPTPIKLSEENIWVEILPTPLGFLRVRNEASTSSSESAKVNPGEKYKYIEKDETENWFLIEFEEGKNGWITSQYAKIIND